MTGMVQPAVTAAGFRKPYYISRLNKNNPVDNPGKKKLIKMNDCMLIQ